MSINSFIETHMTKAGRLVPARLQAALALLERLRSNPSMVLSDHLAGKGSSGLQGHETFGDAAHRRWEIRAINKNHGRRSSNLQDWGDALLKLVFEEAGFDKDAERDEATIDGIQLHFVDKLREILEQDPILVRIRGRSADFVIGDVLKQADTKGRIGEVAQYLVGAKLTLRFGHDFAVVPANKSDRKSRIDYEAKPGDFQFGNTTLEVAMGMPDDKHLKQISEALDDSECEFWLLTRADRAASWANEVMMRERAHGHRVVVRSVEAFVGQNVSELGEFDVRMKATQLEALFDIYNNVWVDKVGTPGIRIVVKR